MKEKIIKILESQFSVVEYEDPDTGFTESTTIDVLTTDEFPDIVDKLEILVNQEVERRIKEMMSDNEINAIAVKFAPPMMYYGVTGGEDVNLFIRRDVIEILVNLRSRLSQKTDNLKENNNNGSTN